MPGFNIAAISTRKMVTLPKNCMLRPDDLLEDFETVGDWTADSGSVAENATEYKVGSKSVKLTTPAGGTGSMTKIVNLTGLQKYEFIEFWFYLHNTTSLYTSFTITLSSTTDFSKKFTFANSATNYLTMPMIAEWNVIRIPLSYFTNTGGEDWANTMVRLRFECVSSSGVINISLDGVSGGYKRIPVVAFYNDDGYVTWYTNGAFQHMKLLGFRATLFMMCHNIRRSTGALHLTPAMCQEMFKAGWEMSDHAFGDPAFAYGTASEAAQEYALGAAEIYIRQHLKCGGFERIHSYSSEVPPHNAATFTALANIQALGSRGGLGHYKTDYSMTPDYLPPGNIQHFMAFAGGGGTLANKKAWVDQIIAHGNYGLFGWDRLDDTGWTTATYNQFMDYIAEKVRAGALHVVTVDELYRLTLGPVTIGAFQPHAAGPFTLPALPVDDGFEDGTMNYWNFKSDTLGRLSVTAGAAMGGSSNGLNINCAANSTQGILEQAILLEASLTDVAYRIYFDPNSVASMSGTGVITRLSEEHTGYRAIAVYFTYAASNYRLCVGGAPDSGTVAWGTAFNITDAPHYLDLKVHRASTDGGTDGYVEIYVDGVLAGNKTGLANYNLFIKQNRLMIGYTGGSATATGDFFIDQVKMNRTGALIGA